GRQEHGCVCVALAVELRVKRPQAGLVDDPGKDGLVFEDGDALDFAVVGLVLDGLDHFGERVDRDGAGQFASGDDVFSGGDDVHAVGGFGGGQVEHHIGAGGGGQHGDLAPDLTMCRLGALIHDVAVMKAVHQLALPLGDALFGALPVHGGDEILVQLRSVDLLERVRPLHVVCGEE